MKLWMLPPGMEESLPDQAWRLESLRRVLLDDYRAHGYQLILPPMVEHLDALLTGSAADMDALTLKLTDPATGKLLGIRSDMTPQAARMAARHFAHQPEVRLCYLATVLRASPEALGASRAPRQVGCELFGVAGLSGDLEILQRMLDTLQLAGVNDVHLDLGHVGVYRAVTAAVALPADDEAALFALLQSKSAPDLSAFATRLGVDQATRNALLALIALHGGVEVLDTAQQALGQRYPAALPALQMLRQTVDALTERSAHLPLHIDLAELRGARYHTGLTFAAFVPQLGRELARGGRYDGVGAEFGAARPATGFSADVNELLRLGGKLPIAGG